MNFLSKLLLFVYLFSFSIPGFASSEEPVNVSLQMRNAPIQEVLQEIEKQTGLTFTYESSLLNDFPPVTFKAENEPLIKCLERLFKNDPFTCMVQGKYIILKRRSAGITVSGFVRSRVAGEALAGATIIEGRSRQGVATDENGFFNLSLPGGNGVVEVSYIGYQRFRYHFHSQERDTIMDIYLEQNNTLKEVVVMGSQDAKHPVLSSRMGAVTVSNELIKAIPTLFGEADVVKTLQTLPGVSPGTEGFSNMYVRGGNGDDNLFQINRNPLYEVNHLGGLFSSFNPEAIESMEFYKGAFPARYGGRLSSVVDITLKEGDMKEYHGSASLGLTSGNIHLNGPVRKDQTAFSFSVRRSWLDALTAPALAIVNKKNKDEGSKTLARYAFTDMNLRLDHLFTPTSRAYVTFYWGDDLFKWGEENFPGAYEKQQGNYTEYFDKDVSKLRWGNLMTSAGWIYQLNEKMKMDINASFTRYRSKLQHEIFYSLGAIGTEEYEESFSNVYSINGVTDLGFQVHFDYLPTPSHHIRYGLDYYHHMFKPEYTKDSYSGNIEIPLGLAANESLAANKLNLYVEDDWSISKAVRVNIGARFNLFEIQEKVYLSAEPRASTRILVTDDVSVKASYARMNQCVHQLSDSYISLPTDMWLPVTRTFKPLVSDQVSVGGYYTLHDYSFSLEGYYKRMENLLDYKDGHNTLPSLVGWENKLASGKGRSYGVEMIANKDRGRLTGWIGYGLMWSDRQFDEINLGERFPSKYDNRHKLNIVANWKLNEKIELTGSWMYMSGNRTTLSLEEYEGLAKPGGNRNPYYGWDILDSYEGRNNFRLPDYHRLDLGINIYRPKKNGRMGIWNVSIYNVYSRINPITIQKSDKKVIDSDGVVRWVPCFKTFGFMPVIPSVTYTLKF